jgi:DNA (cytosine-5)-methyltransferase 1
MRTKTLKFIDLFAGLGGFHLALSQLGERIGLNFECVFASELREDLRKLYTKNFPDVEIQGDITKVDPENIPAHDIICAGFPCQPFSQAGKREGFLDEDRGNLFYNICAIIEKHRPQYIFLENVSNLKGHDDGNTWNVIQTKLRSLNYDVKAEILSPHSFGISQHRRRIYIVGRNLDYGNLEYFKFPTPDKDAKDKCNINAVIDFNDENIVPLKPETRNQLNVWQEFIDCTIAHKDVIPQFPIWAMEFGATYDYESIAPAFQSLEQLQGKRGKLGSIVDGKSVAECLTQLPNYAQTNRNKTFPKWKIRYIEQNRLFYERHKSWLDKWLTKVQNFDNSHLKMEWNCGNDVAPILEDKIIQFRASGIRVKLPTFSPALNLVGTQTPIFPWVVLPHKFDIDGIQQKGRYMTISEAAAIQGMRELVSEYRTPDFPLTSTRILEALGNAVNVTLVKHIAKQIFANE